MRVLLSILLVLVGTSALAEEYPTMEHGTVFGRNPGVPVFAETGRLAVAAESAFFFKTLELFNLDGVLGETFTGYRAPVSLRYRSHDQFGFEAGVLLGHDFGDADRLNQVAPILRLVYEPSPDIFVLGGTIMPTHWLHDALLDDTRKLRTDVEQGFQLRADRRTWKHDTWINWRVREGEETAEEFEIGLANQFRLVDDLFRLDTQFLWTHAGGQVSTSGRIEQNLLYLLGASVGTGWGICKDLRAGYAWLYSRDETDHSDLFKGYGRSYTLHADFRVNPAWRVRLFGEVFDGDRFTATLGDPLYSLGRYDQVGINMLFNLAGDQLQVDAGFVSQATGDEDNLSYQLALVWNGVLETLNGP